MPPCGLEVVKPLLFNLRNSVLNHQLAKLGILGMENSRRFSLDYTAHPSEAASKTRAKGVSQRESPAEFFLTCLTQGIKIAVVFRIG